MSYLRKICSLGAIALTFSIGFLNNPCQAQIAIDFWHAMEGPKGPLMD